MAKKISNSHQASSHEVFEYDSRRMMMEGLKLVSLNGAQYLIHLSSFNDSLYRGVSVTEAYRGAEVNSKRGIYLVTKVTFPEFDALDEHFGRDEASYV